MDAANTLESMGTAAVVDLEQGYVTLFAVVCIGNDADHYSHGGFLMDSATEAISMAQHLNRGNDRCRYLASGVGINPFLLHEVLQRVFHGPKGADD
jgi:hypothetical protein